MCSREPRIAGRRGALHAAACQRGLPPGLGRETCTPVATISNSSASQGLATAVGPGTSTSPTRFLKYGLTLGDNVF